MQYKEQQLSIEHIRRRLAHSETIYTRGENIYHLGGYALKEHDPLNGTWCYEFDGNYGRYEVTVEPDAGTGGESLRSVCTCPYPYPGCKHTVAAFLDIVQRGRNRERGERPDDPDSIPEYLKPEEIRKIALDSRQERARKDDLKLIPGELFKGAHTVRGKQQQEYTVTLYSAEEETGHCTCPDFAVNNLETCKHLIFAHRELKKNHRMARQAREEVFPYTHITWSSRMQKPVCHYERIEDQGIREEVERLFGSRRIYMRKEIEPLFELYSSYADTPESGLVFDAYLLQRIDRIFLDREIDALARQSEPDLSFLKVKPYPYQEEGVRFALFRRACIIADEMGLGKTLQAIAVALLKREHFGFTKTLIISPASLKNQWKLEIERFTSEKAVVVAGNRETRRECYLHDPSYFKITNYEALLRDITTVVRWEPDFVILDEAQRIKNFETKTHRAINRIPRTHSLVITGTPLENKLEDLYGIVEFSDPEYLTPLWSFAAAHYLLSRTQKNRIIGYRNLDIVHEKMKNMLIRRTKKEVFASLPEIIQNTYYLELSREQEEIHQGYVGSLLRIVTKKFLTPMDIRKLQQILLCMRMVCNSTYLIDRKTNHSPKLVELAAILREVVLDNDRKAVIFSEWTTMTYLVGKVLSGLGIDFVEFSGKVPVEKRHLLIEEFRNNPRCMVFLSTDAGGVGLNLQNCDFLINVELPWNPAKLNQRIGRIHRIGQESSRLNVINLVSRGSIEEKVYAGIGLKQELFDAVMHGSAEEVDFSYEHKNRLLVQLREMFSEEIESETPFEFRGPKFPGDELDADVPHFLNPELLDVLSGREAVLADIAAEELHAVGEEGLSESEKRLPSGEGVVSVKTGKKGVVSGSEKQEESKNDAQEEYFYNINDTYIGNKQYNQNAKERGRDKAEESESVDFEQATAVTEGLSAPGSAAEPGTGASSGKGGSGGHEISGEQLEAILNHGMAFLNTLTQAATGRALFSDGEGSRRVEVDRETGEVVLRFKL